MQKFSLGSTDHAFKLLILFRTLQINRVQRLNYISWVGTDVLTELPSI